MADREGALQRSWIWSPLTSAKCPLCGALLWVSVLRSHTAGEHRLWYIHYWTLPIFASVKTNPVVSQLFWVKFTGWRTEVYHSLEQIYNSLYMQFTEVNAKQSHWRNNERITWFSSAFKPTDPTWPNPESPIRPRALSSACLTRLPHNGLHILIQSAFSQDPSRR